MAEEGSTATNYEPYTNGPSPNPDYPQDIHVVTGENTIKIENENQFDKNNVTIYGGYFWDSKIEGKVGKNSTRDKWFYISCQPNTTYIIHKPVTPVQANNRFSVGTTSSTPVDKSKLSDFWHMDDGGATTEHIITTSNSAKFLCVFYGTSPSSNWTEYYPSLLNEIKISYFSSYPINLGNIELCKIGDYQDYFYKENGNWYKYETIKKYIINENTKFYVSKKEKESTFCFQIGNQTSLTSNNNFLRSNFYPNKVAFSTYACTNIYNKEVWFSNPYDSNFTPEMTQTEAAAKFHELYDNKLYYYTVKQSNPTQITDETLISQLDEIYEHLKLAKGTNNISITASDLSPYMKLSYMQDLKSKLDNLDSRLSLLE